MTVFLCLSSEHSAQSYGEVQKPIKVLSTLSFHPDFLEIQEREKRKKKMEKKLGFLYSVSIALPITHE